MTHVLVTFELEPSDPEHSTGLTNEHYDQVMAALASVGADNIEIDLMVEVAAIPKVERAKKPNKRG